MTTETRTATEIADTLHTVLFDGRPDVTVVAWNHDGTDYIITDGTGESTEGVFVYEAADVANWLADCGESPDYSADFASRILPVEDEDVARALWRDLELVALVGGLCTPVIPAPKDIDGVEFEAGDYIQTVGLSPEESDFGEVLEVLPDGRLDVAWAGSESRTTTPPDDLRIISREEYIALREGR